MARNTSAKLQRKAAKAKARNAREAAWRRNRQPTHSTVQSNKRRFYWVEAGENLSNRSALFSETTHLRLLENSTTNGRWVARTQLKVGDILLSPAGRIARIISIPTDRNAEPQVREFLSLEDGLRTASSMRNSENLASFVAGFKYWVVEGDHLESRPTVTIAPEYPAGDLPGRWVAKHDLRVGDVVDYGKGNQMVVTAVFDDPYTMPVLAEPADSNTYWVESGDDLESRAVLRPPLSAAPPNSESGRWVLQRDLRRCDYLLDDRGNYWTVMRVHENPNVRPELKPGKRLFVLAKLDSDPEGPLVHAEVTRSFSNGKKHIIHVYYGDEEIGVTPNHPWYVKNRGWIASFRLQPGDLLLTTKDEWVPVVRVEDRGEIEPVYNIQVEGARTFFVSGANDGPGVLVHNTSPQAQSGFVVSGDQREGMKQFFGADNVIFQAEGNGYRMMFVNKEQALAHFDAYKGDERFKGVLRGMAIDEKGTHTYQDAVAELQKPGQNGWGTVTIEGKEFKVVPNRRVAEGFVLVDDKGNLFSWSTYRGNQIAQLLIVGQAKASMEAGMMAHVEFGAMTLVDGAVARAAGKAAASRFAGMSNNALNKTINAEQHVLLRELFKGGNSSGLTREALEAAAELSRRAIANPATSAAQVQVHAQRLQQIAEAFKKL